ncbi:MAG: transketolase [Anaerolineales bacterium]|nr:MAG: transketolase [Anaerolineales bacterium]
MATKELHDKAINTIRFLAADAVQKANSGHPGLPMGMASAAYVLYTRHMKYNPADPQWPDRDRFILSAGHGSMLLYAMLHLSGYDLPLEELKQFRQWGSKTPGHPEHGLTPGVEMTTGPLGQGFSSGVGMAIATEHLAALYNRDEYAVVDHFIYAIVSDGDLMEGVTSEAASLAGHLRLGRLIYLYDDNRISIDGSTDITFTEDRAARFEAYGWHVEQVADVNDLEALDRAIEAAKADDRPSLIVTRSHIGFGLPTKQDTAAAHGEPPGEEELAGAKDKLGWPQEPSFLVPDDVREHFLASGNRNLKVYESWQDRMASYGEAHPDLYAQFNRTLNGILPAEVRGGLPVFDADAKGMATRASSGKVLNALAPIIPELIGGSADLTGSNKTALKGEMSFTADDRRGRYLHFGVREHGMGAILNGISSHGGLIPFGGTFLVFSDYMRGSVRLAALMEQRVIYVFTHDSIGLGEDGPTHQPIEQLTALRTIPNMVVLRPADANEVAQAWMSALERDDGPTALALTRQALPTIDRAKFESAEGLQKGAYVLADLGEGPPQLILMASGSEVEIILEAGARLAGDGISIRLVSFPSWELFEAQTAEYREQVLPGAIRARVAIEAGITLGWERWVGGDGAIIGINHFGESAPFEELYERFGLTADNVVQKAQGVLARIEASGK